MKEMYDLLKSWRADAEVYRKRWPTDPIAATLDHCAAEVEQVMILHSNEPLSASQYAQKVGLTRQRVVQLIHEGKLEAYQDHQNAPWRIPAYATHQGRAA